VKKATKNSPRIFCFSFYNSSLFLTSVANEFYVIFRAPLISPQAAILEWILLHTTCGQRCHPHSINRRHTIFTTVSLNQEGFVHKWRHKFLLSGLNFSSFRLKCFTFVNHIPKANPYSNRFTKSCKSNEYDVMVAINGVNFFIFPRNTNINQITTRPVLDRF